MGDHKAERTPAYFTEQQLSVIIALCRQDQVTAEFIDRSDGRAPVDHMRTAAVSGVAVTASVMLQERAKMKASIEARLKEEQTKQEAEKKASRVAIPDFPASDAVVPVKPNGNALLEAPQA